MNTLRENDQGPEVQQLQLALRALGKDPGDIDGIFGPRTRAAVIDFQDDVDQLEANGIVGPETWGAIEQALIMVDVSLADMATLAAPTRLSCSDETWKQFEDLIAIVTGRPVIYGPGRGLWHDGQFVITHGPGGLGKKEWKSAGKVGPSFHCSSWTNFVMGVLARRNEDYTHAGNIPPLWRICSTPNVPMKVKGVGIWRGYADICVRVTSDGSTRTRTKIGGQDNIIDLREIWDRRHQLPTFFVCGQSTKRKDGTWRWWHHTVLFVIDHRQQGSPLHRIAADGRVVDHEWSAKPMTYRKIQEDELEDERIYRGYSLQFPEPFTRPVANVTFEI